MEKQVIFLEGLYSNDVADSAPDFILGRGSIAIDKMIRFLDENRKYAVNGYVDYTIKRSKSGTRYAELDLYRYGKDQESLKTSPDAQNAPATNENSGGGVSEPEQYKVPQFPVNKEKPLDVADIPF